MTVHTIPTSFNKTYWAKFDHNDIERKSGGFSK